MFRRTFNSYFAAIIVAVITAVFTVQAFGQIRTPGVTPADLPPVVAPVYPHDFSDKYYTANGVDPKGITERLTGADYLSTFTKTADDRFSSVRMLITLPAYNFGQPVFWSPLGRLTYFDFTQDKAGAHARELATRHPIYVFPNGIRQQQTFAVARQAPVMDDTVSLYAREQNPLGLRQVLSVSWTKTVPTADYDVTGEMIKRNGVALDGGPLVKTVADIKELLSYGLIAIDDEGVSGGTFAITPVIVNAENGGIAKDAFLSTVTRDGKPLEGEKVFVTKFNCAQAGGRCPAQ